MVNGAYGTSSTSRSTRAAPAAEQHRRLQPERTDEGQQKLRSQRSRNSMPPPRVDTVGSDCSHISVRGALPVYTFVEGIYALGEPENGKPTWRSTDGQSVMSRVDLGALHQALQGEELVSEERFATALLSLLPGAEAPPAHCGPGRTASGPPPEAARTVALAAPRNSQIHPRSTSTPSGKVQKLNKRPPPRTLSEGPKRTFTTRHTACLTT